MNDGYLPPKLNYTFVVLIPKVSKPDRITDFRPISLCNVIYKIWSKIIANRIKPVLDEVISPTQSAFVPRRLITDNVLVAFEVNHFLKRNKQTRTHYMALKLDISKAYDRVEWLFLKKVLFHLGFPARLVDLIFLCISTVSYSFLLNGAQFGYLIPARGLRQGDPLSPYLFICCVEIFIRMMESSVARGSLRGVKIGPLAPIISNLCFADDTVLYGRTTLQEAEEISRILNTYARLSGQIIKLEKSSITFSPRTPVNTKVAISQYLGLPADLGRSKREVFNYLRRGYGPI